MKNNNNIYINSICAVKPENRTKIGAHSILKNNYIEATHNKNTCLITDNIQDNIVCSPVELGGIALNKALERGNIKNEDIGLIIANCSTPFRTIPAFACQVAENMNFLVDAFDVISAGAMLSFYVDMFSKLNDSYTSKKIAFVSVSCLTTRLEFDDNLETQYLFEDMAATMILSHENTGLQVKDVCCFSDNKSALTLPLYDALRVDMEELTIMNKERLDKLSKHYSNFSNYDCLMFDNKNFYDFNVQAMIHLSNMWDGLVNNTTKEEKCILEISPANNYGGIVISN